MSALPEIPDFLRRHKPKGEQPVTEAPNTPAPAKPKHKRIDAYKAIVTIHIPLDMSNPTSFSDAASAILKLKDALPANALIESATSMTKIPATEKTG